MGLYHRRPDRFILVRQHVFDNSVYALTDHKYSKFEKKIKITFVRLICNACITSEQLVRNALQVLQSRPMKSSV